MVNYSGEPAIDIDDVRITGQYFCEPYEHSLIAGTNLSVMFCIDRPAKRIWPWFKDFNLWQNCRNHYYSGVIGDLEGKSFHLSLMPNDPDRLDPERHQYRVLKVIDEHLIVADQPIPKVQHLSLPGIGGISPGFHVFMLNEHSGRTVITGLMNHASKMERSGKNVELAEKEAIDAWRPVLQEGIEKWRDYFIPTLKTLVHGRSRE